MRMDMRYHKVAEDLTIRTYNNICLDMCYHNVA